MSKLPRNLEHPVEGIELVQSSRVKMKNILSLLCMRCDHRPHPSPGPWRRPSKQISSTPHTLWPKSLPTTSVSSVHMIDESSSESPSSASSWEGRWDWGAPWSTPTTVPQCPQLKSTAPLLHCKQCWRSILGLRGVYYKAHFFQNCAALMSA